MKLLRHTILFLCLFILIFSSCKKDELLTDSSAKLEFSTDSVLFDTVFTTVGSTTKLFRIYNRHKQPMKISRIFLGAGSSSQFRINIDGYSGTSIGDVEILGGDSLYAFVQVTVNPTSVSSPVLIEDSVIFETNGNMQDVNLTAIGQDVHLHKPDHFPTNGFPDYSIIQCNEVWTNDKPHLIFGYAIVPRDCKLTIMEGTRVHLYNRAVLAVDSNATLVVNGKHLQEVTFQGARLESKYKEVSGQWGKIWLSAGSKDNVIDWAIIKNGIIGLQVDTVFTPGIPTLRLTNTIIRNMESIGLYAQGAHIWSYNCLFANCKEYLAALTIGGKYKFEHCTLANVTVKTQRAKPLLLLNNYYESTNGVTYARDLDSAYFGNCILYGNLEDEIGLNSKNFANFSYKFDHCLLKTTLNTANSAHFDNVLINEDPLFKAPDKNDYQLKEGSPAKDSGNPFINITSDLNGNFRISPPPDMGAYEYQ